MCEYLLIQLSQRPIPRKFVHKVPTINLTLMGDPEHYTPNLVTTTTTSVIPTQNDSRQKDSKNQISVVKQVPAVVTVDRATDDDSSVHIIVPVICTALFAACAGKFSTDKYLDDTFIE